MRCGIRMCSPVRCYITRHVFVLRNTKLGEQRQMTGMLYYRLVAEANVVITPTIDMTSSFRVSVSDSDIVTSSTIGNKLFWTIDVPGNCFLCQPNCTIIYSIIIFPSNCEEGACCVSSYITLYTL